MTFKIILAYWVITGIGFTAYVRYQSGPMSGYEMLLLSAMTPVVLPYLLAKRVLTKNY